VGDWHGQSLAVEYCLGVQSNAWTTKVLKDDYTLRAANRTIYISILSLNYININRSIYIDTYRRRHIDMYRSRYIDINRSIYISILINRH
jgi:hypothetical protein